MHSCEVLGLEIELGLGFVLQLAWVDRLEGLGAAAIRVSDD